MTPTLSAFVSSRQEPAYLAPVRLRARRRVLWMRHQWAKETTQGLAISDAEVDRILSPSGADEIEFYREDPEARELSEQIEAAEAAVRADARWSHLVRRFGLSPNDAALLRLALMVAYDPWWRRVCGYLHDDATANHATSWLAASLAMEEQIATVHTTSPLVRWHLLTPYDRSMPPWSATTPWQADPHLYSWLSDGTSLDPAIAPYTRTGSAPLHRSGLYPETQERIISVVEGLRRDGTTAEIEIVAPPGAGRRTLVNRVCAQLQTAWLSVDAEALFTEPNARELASRVLRSAIFDDAAVYWHNADSVDSKLLRQVSGQLPLTFFGVTAPLATPPANEAVRLSFDLPKLSTRERRALWIEMGGSPEFETLLDSPLLPGEMHTAIVATAAGPRSVRETSAALLRQSAGDLFTDLPLPYEWNDIVLPSGVEAQLRELEQQVRLRYAVLEEWGFERLTPLGRGIAAMFAGPSGTGKTMAVQVLARALGLRIRRVDLSAVVNKYVGETEKHLKLVWDACEREPVILFIDEADALFGQRTQVKDAHDRFANTQINYLLQRMEQFDGIVILATNRKEDLDRAFLRRLRFIIDFLPPAPAERLRLWERALPAFGPGKVPLLDEGIPWRTLAEEIDLTGAGIKSAALRAAFLARGEGARIATRHILTAARRELEKNGHVLRAGDLGGL